MSKQEQTEWLTKTRTLYGNLKRRAAKSKSGQSQFTLEEFRDWLLGQQHPSATERRLVWKCPYCLTLLWLSEVSADHRLALIRDGATVLENLEVCCRGCNIRKDILLPGCFKELCELLRTWPLADSANIWRRLGAKPVWKL